MESEFVSPELLWVAITRGVSLRNLYIVRGVKASMPDVSDFRRFTDAKLKTYILSDKEKGRYDATEGAYSLKHMTEMCKGAYMRRCSGLCGESCDHVMDLNSRDEGISFDRIDCNLGHTYRNLRVVCLACNRRAQNRDANY
jgi:hypothetical protein